MDDFARREPAEREVFIHETAAQMGGIQDEIVEKDFWVCWLLGHLFSVSGHRLIFKGGTSLSKAHGLIDRFSEDIDIVVSREDLGFDESRDELRALSGKKRKKWLADLGTECSGWIANTLQPGLEEITTQVIGVRDDGEPWFERDPGYPQTLLFRYPTGTTPSAESGLIRVVRAEMGAKGELYPATLREVQPYVADKYPMEFTRPTCRVQTLNSERTFWEKATLLHSEYHRNNPVKADRMSRHYLDMFILTQGDVKDRALSTLDLLEDVASHKDLFFHTAWARYNEAQPGKLHLVPQAELRQALEKDYVSTTSELVFGELPSFAEVLAGLDALEKEING